MKSLLAALVALALGVGARQLASQDSASVPPATPFLPEIQEAVTTVDPTLSLDSLGRALTPLRRRQVVVEVEAWMDLVQAGATDLLAAGHNPQRHPSLDGVLDRAYRAVAELERKGGYVAEYTAYLNTVSGRDDTPGLWDALVRSYQTLINATNWVQWLLFVLVLFVSSAILIGFSRLLGKRYQNDPRGAFRRPAIMVAATGLLLILVVLVFPVGEGTRGQLLSLVGLGMTAVIALSSTTLVANAMSGLILRSVRNFEVNDWLRVGEQFGRVTQMGLFHTEIQTEESDLTTLPNSYLISHPVKVVRRARPGRTGDSGGTFVSVTLSLGYDNSVAEIHRYLKQAAEETSVKVTTGASEATIGFEECFVDILDLGDFSVTYRVRGFLKPVKYLLDMRSALRRMIVQTLHQHGVEIVSPTFMNQRSLAPNEKAIPEADQVRTDAVQVVAETLPSELQFPDAEKAESRDELTLRQTDLAERIKTMEAELAAAPEEEGEHRAREKQLERLRRQLDTVARRLEALED